MRVHQPIRRLLAPLAVLAVVAAGCGGTEEPASQPGSDTDAPADDGAGDDTADPDAPVSSDGDDAELPSDGDPDGAAGGTMLALPERREITDGVEDVRERPFEWARYDETDGSLHVVYTTGVEPCNVLADVEVEVQPDAVTVTLLEGYLPDENGEAPVCIQIAEDAAARVPLDEPLGDRVVVDGATGEEVRLEVVTMEDAAAS